MRTFKQRVLVTLAATILAAACGILAGWLVGRLIVLKLTERRLLQVAVRASMQTDSRLKEATSVLAAMQATSSEPCSPSELTYFRALIFDARYLKDAGRMSGGTIACSASLARPSLRWLQPNRTLPSLAAPMSTRILLPTRATIKR